MAGLRKGILVSLLGHIAVFSMFSLSFGTKVPRMDYANSYFLGQFLPHLQLQRTEPLALRYEQVPSRSFLAGVEEASHKPAELNFAYGMKPLCNPVFNKEKMLFSEKAVSLPPMAKRREPDIILHPLLPYGFTLYFKNRQIAHVELEFKVSPAKKASPVVIKRKLSSGSLDVDLLCMRYIGHYLFLRQGRFPEGTWQSLKIDLEAKND